MTTQLPRPKKTIPISQKLLNKTFYKFMFSFVAVVVSVLFFILVIGEVVG